MSSILSFLSILIFHLFLLVLFFVIGDLSRILGAAQKQKKIYWGFIISGLSVVAGLVVQLVNPELMVFSLLLLIGALGVAIFITLYYWKWLFKELVGGN